MSLIFRQFSCQILLYLSQCSICLFAFDLTLDCAFFLFFCILFYIFSFSLESRRFDCVPVFLLLLEFYILGVDSFPNISWVTDRIQMEHIYEFNPEIEIFRLFCPFPWIYSRCSFFFSISICRTFASSSYIFLTTSSIISFSLINCWYAYSFSRSFSINCCSISALRALAASAFCRSDSAAALRK